MVKLFLGDEDVTDKYINSVRISKDVITVDKKALPAGDYKIVITVEGIPMSFKYKILPNEASSNPPARTPTC
jgi:hypothetical protein